MGSKLMTPREMLAQLEREAALLRDHTTTRISVVVNADRILAIAAWVRELEETKNAAIEQFASEERIAEEQTARAERLQHQVDTLTAYLKAEEFHERSELAEAEPDRLVIDALKDERVRAERLQGQVERLANALLRVKAGLDDALAAINEEPKG